MSDLSADSSSLALACMLHLSQQHSEPIFLQTFTSKLKLLLLISLYGDFMVGNTISPEFREVLC
jgi:hypothetical protein